MKLKYYLRGIGIGVILTAVIMGIALGGRGRNLSDAEIMERARKLGMVEAEGTLSDLVYTDSASQEEADDEAVDGAAADDDMAGDGEPGEGITLTPLVPEAEEASPSAEAEDGEAAEDIGETGLETEVQSPETVEEAAEPAADDTVEPDHPEGDTDHPAEEGETALVDPSYISINIPRGIGSDSVALMLERAGLVDNATAFNQYLIERRQDRIIRTGNKTIPTGASYEQIASIITK
ncbi:MAG: hypothetical protein IJT34_05015 [Butyrivibrio sp.]|nr:hypothetical protein [Butyrivibrio sp.]